MRTRGFQKGRVEIRGKLEQKWYGNYYVYARDAAGQEVRRHVGIVLGPRAKLLKCEAKEKLARFIKAEAAIEKQLRELIAERKLDAAQQRELEEQVQGIIDSEDDPEVGAASALKFLSTWVQPTPDRVTLEWFTRERFVPMKKTYWAPSTRETNAYSVEKILSALGPVPLAKLDKFKCQMFINDLAEPREGLKTGFSFTVIDHCRTMLKAILEEALDADLIGKNPARKMKMPETREPEKSTLPKDQARLLLEALPFRDRLMAMIAAFCAMRPGEIFGLRWTSWREDHFQIEGTAWRGTLRPGKAKTKGSKAPVVIPNMLIPALKMWRKENASAPADALIFPSGNGKTPLRPENWLRRRLKPIATKLKIAVPVNFQVLRRTFATNAEGHGNPRDVMAHLRHSDIATTMNVYQQAVPESVRKMVNDVTQDVMTAEAPEVKPVPMPEPLTRSIQ